MSMQYDDLAVQLTTRFPGIATERALALIWRIVRDDLDVIVRHSESNVAGYSPDLTRQVTVSGEIEVAEPVDVLLGYRAQSPCASVFLGDPVYDAFQDACTRIGAAWLPQMHRFPDGTHEPEWESARITLKGSPRRVVYQNDRMSTHPAGIQSDLLPAVVGLEGKFPKSELLKQLDVSPISIAQVAWALRPRKYGGTYNPVALCTDGTGTLWAFPGIGWAAMHQPGMSWYSWGSALVAFWPDDSLRFYLPGLPLQALDEAEFAQRATMLQERARSKAQERAVRAEQARQMQEEKEQKRQQKADAKAERARKEEIQGPEWVPYEDRRMFPRSGGNPRSGDGYTEKSARIALRKLRNEEYARPEMLYRWVMCPAPGYSHQDYRGQWDDQCRWEIWGQDIYPEEMEPAAKSSEPFDVYFHTLPEDVQQALQKMNLRSKEAIQRVGVDYLSEALEMDEEDVREIFRAYFM